ncbi:unnamed protein product [Prunus armeniaca]
MEANINKLASKIKAITSTMHQKIRYLIPKGGVSQINSDQAMARKCSAQGLEESNQAQFVPINQGDLKGGEQVEEEADPIHDSRANRKE